MKKETIQNLQFIFDDPIIIATRIRRYGVIYAPLIPSFGRIGPTLFYGNAKQ
jgi:hypothetical protein